MKQKVKVQMTRRDIKMAKGQHIATFTAKHKLIEPGTNEPPVSDLAKPGFYIFVHPARQIAYARFFVGRQRSKCGLGNIISQIRRQRTSTGITLMEADTAFDIYFISLDNMKALTNGYGKGKLALKLTRAHRDSFQNLDELNRMLNDNFSFYAQWY